MDELRGWLVRPLRDASPERSLIAAIVRQALRDARRGSPEAARWLDDVAPVWCERFLGLDAAKVRAWRSADLRVRLTDLPGYRSDYFSDWRRRHAASR